MRNHEILIPFRFPMERRIPDTGGLYLLRHHLKCWHNQRLWPIVFLLPVAFDLERTVIIFRLIWFISIYVRSFMRRFMPTNIAITALRSRNGLKWAAPAMLLAIPYLYAASFVTVLIDDGASKWLYLVFLVCVWNALKFIVNGIVCVGILVRVRLHERRLRQSPHATSEQAREQLVGV